jgi:hypothetical protein
MDETLDHGGYRATLHWGIARDGFDSILGVYNYYGDVFANATPNLTDAELFVTLFDEQGARVGERCEPISTKDTVHLRIGDIASDFRGLVATQMVPRGRMRRLSGTGERPIATSYFMLYERAGGYRDFSHELFLARDKASTIGAEWASLVYSGDDLRAGVVVMNNCPLCDGAEFHTIGEVRVLGLDGSALARPYPISLKPGGSLLLMLDEAFPEIANVPSSEARSVVVRATNIEQPMTFHLRDSGDFNLHHF